MNDEELKPCPFCGGKAELHYFSHLGGSVKMYYIVCTKCEIQTATTHEPKTKIIKRWNKRFKMCNEKTP